VEQSNCIEKYIFIYILRYWLWRNLAFITAVLFLRVSLVTTLSPFGGRLTLTLGTLAEMNQEVGLSAWSGQLLSMP
jgi:hypothetical protein